MRPSWSDYFMGIAVESAKRATCPVKQVGSVFVDPKTKAILTIGYNGSPRKTSHCGKACYERVHGERSEECKAIHSEMNAICNAALNGVKLDGAMAYITLSPCLECARALIQVGVRVVFYKEESAYPEGPKLLSEGGVQSYRYDIGPECS